MSADITGFHVSMTFSDGTAFFYDASDDGYSTWDIATGKVE